MNNIEKLENGIHKIWWVPLVTGIIALGLGVWCFCSPETSLEVFAYAFAWCLLFAGAMNVSYSMTNARLHTNWGWSLVLGIIELICAIWLLSMPGTLIAVAFAYAAGIWMLVVAINGIGEAAYFARHSVGWTIWMIILLIATIFFAAYFLFNPLLGGVFGWMWIGFSLLFFGIWRISLAFKIRNFNK